MNELKSGMQFLQDLLTLYQLELRIREDNEISDDRKKEIISKIRIQKNILLMRPYVEQDTEIIL